MKLCRNIFSQKCLTTVFSFSCSFYYFLAAFFNCEKPRNKSQSWPPNKQLFVVRNILEARRSKVKSHCRSSFLLGNFFPIFNLDKVGNTDIKGHIPLKHANSWSLWIFWFEVDFSRCKLYQWQKIYTHKAVTCQITIVLISSIDKHWGSFCSVPLLLCKALYF